MRSTVNDESLRDALLEIIGYSVTSARELLDESPHYGPLRLIEVARRMLDAMVAAGLCQGDPTDLSRRIGDYTTPLHEGEEAFRAYLDSLMIDVLEAF